VVRSFGKIARGKILRETVGIEVIISHYAVLKMF